MVEEWKDIPRYEGLYKASSMGRILSSFRQIKCKSPWGGMRVISVPEKILKATRNSQGYRIVRLYKDKKAKDHAVSRLVLLSFTGPPDDETIEACHKDGSRDNNILSNLRWGTPKQNMEDRERHGRHDRGVDSVKAKLREKDIHRIRLLLEKGEISMNRIGIRFGVDVATIRDIKIGRTWKHVPIL